MISLLLLLTTCSAKAQSSEFKMHYDEYSSHDNYWTMFPEIVICKNQTVFTKSQIEYAIEVWGEKYSKVSIKENCSYKVEIGKIKITDGKYLKFGQAGFTTYDYRDSKLNQTIVKEIGGALIELDRNVTDVTLLIHELGHSFGYDHYNDKQDVMNTTSVFHKSGNYPY